jgi:hypothetical protein
MPIVPLRYKEEQAMYSCIQSVHSFRHDFGKDRRRFNQSHDRLCFYGYYSISAIPVLVSVLVLQFCFLRISIL